MIKVDEIEVWGFPHAIRGMRNPMNSWDRSDSIKITAEECKVCIDYDGDPECKECAGIHIGTHDLALMQKLYKAGTEHRKYLRQIFASMDVIAPLYWWKEFDTYKVGTAANSCSTMHKITAKAFEESDFSFDGIADLEAISASIGQVTVLNKLREKYLETKDKATWCEIIKLLPESYNQRRTITMDYENAFSMIKQREGHKLQEWQDFVEVLKGLPYVREIGGLEY